ncbi:FG-GAP-like repeat-containing protein [Streptomyces sp. NPDC094049]|uniref:FG-GAP-like repeat-containing protein n=1 Tax=Streptomyces sp. NPDC094049 TaxID=3154987 RepID=UPI00332CE2F6
MSRFTRARRPRARIAVLTTALLASGAGLAPFAAAAPTAGTDRFDRLDITPNPRTVPRHDTVLSAGPTGYAHAPEDADGSFGDGVVWTDLTTGADTPLGAGAGNGTFADFGTGGRYAYSQPGVGIHVLRDLVTGTQRPLAMPRDASYRGLLGDTLLFQRYASADDFGTTTGYYLARADDPAAPPVEVTGWPADARLHHARLAAGDASTAVIRFGRSTDPHSYDFTDLGLVDLRTGRMTVVPAPTSSQDVLVAAVAVSPDRFAWVDRDRTVHLRDRTDPTGAERTFALPEGLSAARVGLVGDWVLALGEASGTDASLRRELVALHPDGRRQRLLGAAEDGLTQITGGGTAVVGGTSATDWALLKAVPGKGSGAPVLEKLRRVEPLAARTDGIAFGAGRLTTLEQDGPGGRGFYGRNLPVGPVHAGQSAPVWQGAEQGAEQRPTPLFDGGDGRTVSYPRVPYTDRAVVSRAADGRTTRVAVGQDGRIADAFGRWTVFQTGTPSFPGQLVTGGQTVVVDTDASKVLSRQTQTAAALWGDTLFTGTAATGEVVRKDLATGKDLGKVATGSGCPLTELQAAAGRWLYWACGSYAKQGVVDLKSGARITLPRSYGEGGLLGDGYYVDQNNSSLRLVDFTSGRAVASGLVDSVPVYGPRREAWAVDRFGGGVAYKDADDLVHVVWPGVAASDLTAASARTPGSARAQDGWKASWALSKPASIWRLTVRDPYTGAAVRSFGGQETRNRIEAVWDGRTSAGKPSANGPYSWDLTANTADGKGRDLVLSGTVTLTGGTPGRRDLAGNDRQGDLLATDAAGQVSMYRGNAFGGLSGRVAGTGAKFPKGTVLVPFGDVNGDGCADVLAKVGDQLRAYRPGCGAVVSASSPYTAIGSGWGQYDVLTSPGDVNGDGYTDLIARQTSTGDMYFYAGTADHRVKSRVRTGTNWKLYKKIVGAGDLNGDGRGDLLGVDGAGVLWRYYGTATGGVTARVRVGGGWGGYSSLIGVGDLSGDGRTDLLARDTAGSLYAYHGTGGGAYGGRTLLGGGWNVFTSLS